MNAVSPQAKPHSKAPPQASGALPCMRAVECYHFGGPHLVTECQHKDTECKFCKKRGHLALVCCSKKADANRPPQQCKKIRRANPQQTHSVAHVAADTAENDTDAFAYTLFSINFPI